MPEVSSGKRLHPHKERYTSMNWVVFIHSICEKWRRLMLITCIDSRQVTICGSHWLPIKRHGLKLLLKASYGMIQTFVGVWNNVVMSTRSDVDSWFNTSNNQSTGIKWRCHLATLFVIESNTGDIVGVLCQYIVVVSVWLLIRNTISFSFVSTCLIF